MEEIVLPDTDVSLQATMALLRLQSQGGQVMISALCGIDLAGDTAPRTQGSILVSTDAGRFEGPDWQSAITSRDSSSIVIRQTAATDALEVQTTWAADAATGVVSRNDLLTNASVSPMTIQRCLARVTLPSGQYEVYAQQSRWCNENQGAWQALHAGAVTLRHVSGRTTQGGTPYACIRNKTTGHGLVLHVLPCGNWLIRFSLVPSADSEPSVVVELGLSDENLRMTLQPGDTIELPELLFQTLQQGEPHLSAPMLHEYMLARHFASAKPEAPVVYNTWFDQFEVLDVPRLRQQLAAAKAVGCDVFVIDAGWYGAGDANWWAQAGDWREKTSAAFHGRMRDFADEVRAAGLGFGLWMEPERVCADTPIRAAHPDWFVPVGAAARIDLAKPQAYVWLRNEIGRLVETYALAWMKLDFNFDLDYDAAGFELSAYTALWYQMLDEIRTAYPTTFFEGCASGAMRLDINALSHVDGHFLSDTVDSTDMLRIAQGAYLRLPPGRLTRWAVLRSPGKVIPRYTLRAEDSPDTVLVPGGALWEPAHSADLDFALLATMPGMLGFSGDLASLSPVVAARVGEHITFYKKWRRFIAGAVAHLLTPPEPITARSGWVTIQLQNPADSTSLVFVYRLGVAPHLQRIPLRGLSPTAKYSVQRAMVADAQAVAQSGAELMSVGLAIDLPAVGGSRTSAGAVYEVKALL